MMKKKEFRELKERIDKIIAKRNKIIQRIEQINKQYDKMLGKGNV